MRNTYIALYHHDKTRGGENNDQKVYSRTKLIFIILCVTLFARMAFRFVSHARAKVADNKKIDQILLDRMMNSYTRNQTAALSLQVSDR